MNLKKLKEMTDIVHIIEQFTSLSFDGSNYVGLCPLHMDTHPSFVAYPPSQRYYCHGCGAQGDVVDFIQAVQNCSFVEAKKWLTDYVSDTVNKPITAVRRATATTVQSDGLELVMPLPTLHVPNPPSAYKVQGEYREPCARYRYTNEQGQTMYYILRFNLEFGRKEFKPLTLWRTPGEQYRWRIKAPNTIQLLYNLHLLTVHRECTILMTEGEKCVDAVMSYLRKVVQFGDTAPIIPCTWHGGARALCKTDFGPLANRRIIYWPDADNAGNEAMQTLQRQYGGVVLDVDADKYKKGWDVADLVQSGGDVLDFIRENGGTQ